MKLIIAVREFDLKVFSKMSYQTKDLTDIQILTLRHIVKKLLKYYMPKSRERFGGIFALGKVNHKGSDVGAGVLRSHREIFSNSADGEFANLHEFFEADACTPEKLQTVDDWALYCSLILGAQRFATLYSGFKSHEERLTGHLISEIFTATEIVKKTLIENEAYKNLSLKLVYSDIATKWLEGKTGADFGLIIVRHNAANTPTYVPLRFQAKKATVTGKSNVLGASGNGIKQLDILCKCKCGVYIYYYAGGKKHRAIIPFVQTAITVDQKRASLTTVDTFDDGEDMVSFLMRMALGNSATHQWIPPHCSSFAEAFYQLCPKDIGSPPFLVGVVVGAPIGYDIYEDLETIPELKESDVDPEATDTEIELLGD
jgi:hypothetical protein